MSLVAEVYYATHGKPFGWGHTKSVELDGEPYSIEWVEYETGDYDGPYDQKIRAVFKINYYGEDRFFVQEGSYTSYEGNDWNGPFYEAEEVPVKAVEYRRKQ